LDISHQLSIVRTRLPLLVVAVLLAASVAYLLSGLQPKVYEARTTLLAGLSLSEANPNFDQLLVSQRLSATYASLATTTPILEKVIERLDLDVTPVQLAKRVAATTAGDSSLLTVSARELTPMEAAALANAVASELIAASPTVQGQETEVLESIDEDLRSIREEIRAAQTDVSALLEIEDRTPSQAAALASLRDRLISLRSTYATLLSLSSGDSPNRLTVIQPALIPDSPVAPRPLLDAGLAAIAALLAVSGIVFILEYLDDALKNPEAVEATLGLPTLGMITRMPRRGRESFYRLPTLLHPRSADAEAYRTLRTNIDFAVVDQPARTILVTSAVPSEGKTVTASNLAVVMAQAGRRTLLVDADLRNPAVHGIFRLPNDLGLTDLLRGTVGEVALVARATEQSNLAVLTAGALPPNPAELLGSQRMRSVLEGLAREYETVVFDSPPVVPFTDAAVLSAFLDATILVVAVRRGRRGQLRSAREALARANARVVGVVLNGLPRHAQPDYGPYYGSARAIAAGPNAASTTRSESS